jgi:hypothetical protein
LFGELVVADLKVRFQHLSGDIDGKPRKKLPGVFTESQQRFETENL